jgi:fibronectin-binding autotransporter adhesin
MQSPSPRKHRITQAHQICLALLVTLASHTSVRADTAIWVGETQSFDWFQSTNWSGSVVPNSSTQDVLINQRASSTSPTFVTLTTDASVRDLTMTAKTWLQVSGSRLKISGTVNNNGFLSVSHRITDGELVGFGAVDVVADTLVTGKGGIWLSLGALQSSTGSTLTIAKGSTVGGYGQIGGSAATFKVVNHGVIQAAGEPADLFFQNVLINNTDGLIELGYDSSLSLSGTIHGGIIHGGIIRVDPTSPESFTQISGGGGETKTGFGTFSDLMIQGSMTIIGGRFINVNFVDGNQMIGTNLMGGTITGALQVGLDEMPSSSILDIEANTLLNGSGRLNVARGGGIDTSTQSTLTIGNGYQLTGSGALGGIYGRHLHVINRGTITATGLTFGGDTLINRGKVEVSANESFRFHDAAGFIQDVASAITQINGELSLPAITLRAGTLSGVGTIIGDVLNEGGRVSPGESHGTLHIQGDYVQGPDGSLVIEIAGDQQGVTHDWLDITGNATLGGTLYLDITDDLQQGGTFTFLTTSLGHVRGMFDRIYADGWNVTAHYGSQSVSITLMTSAVPEPAGLAMLFSGVVIAGIGTIRNRRKA